MDLHSAEVPIKTIMMTLGVSRATFYRVLKSGNVDRKKRVGSWNKKLDEKFLKKISKAIEADPMEAMEASQEVEGCRLHGPKRPQDVGQEVTGVATSTPDNRTFKRTPFGTI